MTNRRMMNWSWQDIPEDQTPARTKERRKAIPEGVKVLVTAKQNGMCHCRDKQRISFEPCGKHLLDGGNDVIHFNHDPPLGLRTWSDHERDYEPPQNDPEYLFAVRGECHARMTGGSAGRSGGRGTDLGDIARLKRIIRKRDKRAADKLAETLRVAADSTSDQKQPSGSGAPVRRQSFVASGSTWAGSARESDNDKNNHDESKARQSAAFPKPQGAGKARWPKREFPKQGGGWPKRTASPSRGQGVGHSSALLEGERERREASVGVPERGHLDGAPSSSDAAESQPHSGNQTSAAPFMSRDRKIASKPKGPTSPGDGDAS
jgi:hypothetical protein